MSTSDLQGLRVLLVEDQMIVAMQIEDMLHAAGCEVVGPVGTLEAAIALAHAEVLDVAVLDVNLDGEKVYPAAEELQARGIPFILATGYGASTLPEKWRHHAGSDHELPIDCGQAISAPSVIGLMTVSLDVADQAGVLAQVGLPEEGIALILGVDRLLDMTRTAVNITGDATVTSIVAVSEGALDRAVFNDPEARPDLAKSGEQPAEQRTVAPGRQQGVDVPGGRADLRPAPPAPRAADGARTGACRSAGRWRCPPPRAAG